MDKKEIPPKVVQTFREGTVIPMLPLALSDARRIDEERQRALIRYYIDAGAGGIAVEAPPAEMKKTGSSLHTTLLTLASETIDRWCERKGRQIFKIVGIAGRTKDSTQEAEAAYRLGYHACLIDLAGLPISSDAELLDHSRTLAGVMPLVGHCLASPTEGRALPLAMWRSFAEIDNVVGVVLAPHDRYQTLAVVRAVCEAGREKDIALYTGNDDNVLIDLLTSYKIPTESGVKQVRIAGGLLAQWGVWTSKAVDLLKHVHSLVREGRPLPLELLSMAVELTDASGAILDAGHSFAGRSAGINEVLRRQGLLREGPSSDSAEALSVGQAAEIDRVLKSYPHLRDDDYVGEGLSRWLSE